MLLQESTNEFTNIQEELVEQLNETQQTNNSLEYRIGQLVEINEQLESKQPVYIARRDSMIDKELARIINAKYPEASERLKIMFIRESEGVYVFGSKRVFIKCEKGNQLYVRVGGGYLHIDEFVKTYTEMEQEKIERRNAIHRFREKLAVQSIASNFPQEKHESSPIRMKKNKIDFD